MHDKLKTEIYEKLVDTFTDVESDLNKKINDILEKYNTEFIYFLTTHVDRTVDC